MSSLDNACALELSEKPPDPDQMIGAVDPEIQRGGASLGAPKWLYDPGPPPTIRMLGESCQDLDSGRRVNVQFSCALGP